MFTLACVYCTFKAWLDWVFSKAYFCFNLILKCLVCLCLVKPTAVINCSTNVTVKEGDNVECLCHGIGGDPLPAASWYKNGKKVNGSGYLKKTLSLKSILKEHAGNYSCIVNNTVFEDVKQIEIKVQCKYNLNMTVQ